MRLVDLTTDELRHQALHDPLTGLPNRALVSDRAEQMLARGRRNGVEVAALFVDLDAFKNINDTLGHEAGDQLLRAVSARLTRGLRGADTVGRLGGDEFVVLVDGEPPIAPELVAERLLEVMQPPFQLTGSREPIKVSVSIGIAAGLRDTVGELLRDADMALYRAKAAGRNRYEVFRPELETTLRHEMALGRDLHVALEREQFRLVYQPIYNLDDLSLVSVEALLRWEHPVLGVIQPNDFIPLLEASGKIVDVGRWVLTTACRQMASWHARGSTLGIAVNVSARQLDGRHHRDPGPRGAAVERARPRRAHGRDHRDRPDEGRGGHRTTTSPDQGAGRQAGDRRLRHRLLLAWRPCRSSPSTRSRSTAPSPTRSIARRNRTRSSGPWSSSAGISG